ncbi:MAG TPA: hypothetical protein VFV67_05220 [Actinophytocola sp.]|uniref:hypothetical protein n=1 Tax=Actinophytocola sp. TaxID=1872138 RepID=UPI002DBB45DD|nr:hypothetical protein [Actinophytocola sp.]HEU5470033.1 hypothetical protein [Actinophytocola sp.]
MRLLLPRLVSPAGFVLALLFFLLPFVAVACDAPQNAGSVDVGFTGLDLVTGAEPTLTATGELATVPREELGTDELPEPGAQLPAILTVVLITAGLVASLLPALRARPLVIGGGAALAAALLAGTELIAQANLKASVLDLAGTAVRLGGDTFAVTDAQARDLVHSRIGFWLALVALVLVLLWSVRLALRDRSRR